MPTIINDIIGESTRNTLFEWHIIQRRHLIDFVDNRPTYDIIMFKVNLLYYVQFKVPIVVTCRECTYHYINNALMTYISLS